MKKKRATRTDLTLEAGCTLRDSIDMQFQLLTVTGNGKHTVVDGAQVERIDTAGLQLLVAFARQQSEAGRPLRWQGASEILVSSCHRLGLGEVLGLQAPPPREAASP